MASQNYRDLVAWQNAMDLAELRSKREFLHHLSIAHGSLRELETQVLLARRLRYLNDEQTRRGMVLAGEVGRLLNGLYNALAVPSEAVSGRG